MNHEFRAKQQAARERQAALARWQRYRSRAYYLLAFAVVVFVLWFAALARRG